MSEADHLESLDALLLAVTEEDGMLLSEFDGYCAGLVVCPDVIPPSEWLPHVWGANGAPMAQSGEELQQAFELVMAHYNDVARSLMPPVFDYGPILEHDERSEETIWEMWVSGFERAMRLRTNAWEKIIEGEDEEAGASVSMMLALHEIAEGTSDLPKGSIEDLRNKAPELIADMVIALNGWTKRRPKAGFVPPGDEPGGWSASFRGRKVGRNEPCPCGSGRKYKRCCGAN